MVTGEMSYDEVIVYFRKPSADIDGAVFDLHLIVRLHNGLLILLFFFFFGEFLGTGLHWTPAAACIPQRTPPLRDTVVVLMIDENIQGIFPFECHYL